MSHQSEFEVFVRGHRGEMVATAAALTAGDRHLAEDLTQSALVRLYLAWGRARGPHAPAYARRVLVNCFLDHRRRAWVSRERSMHSVPDAPAVELADDPELFAALRELPPRMRAAVVLRHVEDRSVEDVADALGCSVGTVKSQTARGLAKLRAQLKDAALQGGNHD
ncbi:RNA polymerase sigma-70 factor, sigma-E family [Nocardioides terrae]|uniref:RNA polymerase sigma-70 factor, sigma-E family n=1 Tax=Nocardioides terrae TaxID=574651 RepID=A0A1I1LW05_9ACTN|nr:SigE family RNA polymerase sigma factor [Nocardioides terrae]SFC76662.1 RNA polymerase sigma-70 factor, sigma-E family [Nocardioides terrae]